WQYFTAADDSIETYDVDGRLLGIKERNGWTSTLTYSSGATTSASGGGSKLLTRVQNNFGKAIEFSYDAKNRVATVKGPDGAEIHYAYNTDRSVTVTWPDQTVRRYHHGDDTPGLSAYLPGALTGITDER
ncbi:hypothetical protein AB4Z50_36215, partial [Paenibacillus sp. 2TAB26]